MEGVRSEVMMETETEIVEFDIFRGQRFQE